MNSTPGKFPNTLNHVFNPALVSSDSFQAIALERPFKNNSIHDVEEKMILSMKRTRVLLFAVLVLALCFTRQALASSVVVGTCIPSLPQFTTIQAAVNSVPVGGTVEVCPGTYAEQVTITKKLILTGIQSGTGDAAVIVPPSTGIVANGTDIFGNPVAAQILVNSLNGAVTVERLTVDGTGNNLAGCVKTTLEGIYFENTSGTITNNVVRNQFQTDYAAFGGCQNGLAINIESTGMNANTVTISANSVRAYQKNGITATGAATGVSSLGPAVTITGNYIVGLGATAMNWQGVYLNEGTAAENGVQVGFGATGKVENNIVNDNIWGQDTSSDTGDAASGILIFASSGITVTGNEVGSAQFGIVTVTDGGTSCTNSTGTPVSCGTADTTTITLNKVAGTQIFDAIDACSNTNTIQSNTIYGSTESGIHLDDSCTGSTNTSGNNNIASKNIIVEACAGILLGTGMGNTTSPNTLFDVTNTTLAGDVCPAAGTGNVEGIRLGGLSERLRPSPYRPTKRK